MILLLLTCKANTKFQSYHLEYTSFTRLYSVPLKSSSVCYQYPYLSHNILFILNLRYFHIAYDFKLAAPIDFSKS